MSAAKKQRGLGRGLDALLGDAPKERAGAEKPGPRAVMPIEFLEANPDQPRRKFAEDALDELAASIRARGLLQPILVRPKGEGRYEIVAGERRWRAAQRARLHEVPVIVRELTDEETAEIALIENVQRVDLSPVEEARAYKRLAEHFKRSQDEIARAVGKSRSHVANTLRLLALPEKALAALADGAITPGHARAMLAAPKADFVLDAVLERGLSVRATEMLVKAAKTGSRTLPDDSGRPRSGGAAPKTSAPGKKDADTRALEADLAAALGLEVEIAHEKGGGAVTIRYRNLDQLDDVCRRLTGQLV